MLRDAHKLGCNCHHVTDQHFGTTLKIFVVQCKAKPARTLTCGNPLGTEDAGGAADARMENKLRCFACVYVQRKMQLFLSIYVDDIKTAKKNGNWGTVWKHWSKTIVLEDPTPLLSQAYLCCIQLRVEMDHWQINEKRRVIWPDLESKRD